MSPLLSFVQLVADSGNALCHWSMCNKLATVTQFSVNTLLCNHASKHYCICSQSYPIGMVLQHFCNFSGGEDGQEPGTRRERPYELDLLQPGAPLAVLFLGWAADHCPGMEFRKKAPSAVRVIADTVMPAWSQENASLVPLAFLVCCIVV